MNTFIVFSITLLAIWSAGAEPPRTFRYQQPAAQQQFGQQQQQDGYPAAGAPSGQLLLLPGEYVVQYNSAPYRQYGAPESVDFPATAPQQFAGQDPNYYTQAAQQQQFGARQANQFNAPSQFGQYTAQAELQQPQFGQRVANRPAFSGQLKVQPGKFSGQLNAGEEFEDEADEQQESENPQVKAKNQRGNVKYNKAANQPEPVDEQYQQGRYVQRGSSRYTNPKSQVENLKQNGNQQGAATEDANNDDDSSEADDENQEFSGKYTQKSGKYTAGQQQEVQGQLPSRTFFFGRYTQSNEPQGANVQSEYSKVNKYTPPGVYGRSTTEKPEASTTEDSNDSTTTEISTTTDANDDAPKENYTNGQSENTKSANGFYYLLLPDGKLQKIVYMTEEDLKQMAFVARLQYQNVEPIQGPVYSYNPENSPFVQLY